MTLSEFLLARIAEDEAAAKAASTAKRPRGGWGFEDGETGERWETRDRRSGMLYVPSIENPADAALWDDEGGCDYMAPARPVGIHMARHDPARVLAECAAKRRIVELRYSWNLQAERMSEPPFGPILQAQVNTADAVLRSLAMPYADHPDYDESWRP